MVKIGEIFPCGLCGKDTVRTSSQCLFCRDCARKKQRARERNRKQPSRRKKEKQPKEVSPSKPRKKPSAPFKSQPHLVAERTQEEQEKFDDLVRFIKMVQRGKATGEIRTNMSLGETISEAIAGIHKMAMWRRIDNGETINGVDLDELGERPGQEEYL